MTVSILYIVGLTSNSYYKVKIEYVRSGAGLYETCYQCWKRKALQLIIYNHGVKKNLLYVIGIVSFIVFGCLQFSAKAEEICMTSCEWAPYASENLPNYGFTSEIINAAFKHVGYKVTFEFYPWKRAMMMVKQGKCDGVYSAYYTSERSREYALSDPYIESRVYLCTLKNNPIKYKSFKDLIPYKIGVVMGYSNTEEFDNADFLTKDEAPNELLNLKKILRGRVDLIVIDRYVAIDNLKNSAFLEGSISDIQFLEPPLKMVPVHIMFSKAIPGYEKKVRDFNKGLQAVKHDGTIDDILKKYGFNEVN